MATKPKTTLGTIVGNVGRTLGLLPTYYAEWPPRMCRLHNMGYIAEVDNKDYFRDIGRSSFWGNKVIFQFGDTYSELDGDIGLATSTATMVVNPKKTPLKTKYQLILPTGQVETVPELLPDEHRAWGWRTVIWCHGGIAWQPCNAFVIKVTGWTFFQKSLQNCENNAMSFRYTGIAKVTMSSWSGRFTMDRLPEDPKLFNADEPRFGTFTALTVGEYIYCFGHLPGTCDVVLARVLFTDASDKSKYQYWDGNDYQDDMKKCAIVINDVQHGSVWRSKLFRPNTGRDWVLLGNTEHGTNKVLMAAAPRLEGPYKCREVFNMAVSNPDIPYGTRSCAFAHPWAFKELDGHLMVTWFEGTMLGRVTATQISFRREDDKIIDLTEIKGETEVCKGTRTGQKMHLMRK